MSWSGRRVLVTGAGGFIGSHLAERLTREGASVRALVHYNALGSWGWLDRSEVKDDLEVVAGDVVDRDGVEAACEGVEVVFHLAALIAIPYSYAAPESYVRTNVGGTLNVLQAARRHGARVVHTSTSEVYGSAQQVPISEAHPLVAQSPYAASKTGADQLALSFHRSFGLPVTVVRPFNAFGPRQSARAVIPTIITQALSGADVIKLGNLTPTRDFNYVGNTVDGFLAAAGADAALGRTVNLGSGREVSIGELAERIVEATGSSARVEQDPTRVRPEGSEVDRLLADSSLAQELLGWAPRVSLEEGLSETVAWLRDNLGGYRPGDYTV